jgi:WD40 repeat protein
MMSVIKGELKCWPQDCRVFSGHSGQITSIGFSPNGKLVVSGLGDCTIRIWDMESGRMVIRPLKGHTDWIRSIGFSPDGKLVVSGSDDCNIQIWDVESERTVVGPLEGHKDCITSVRFLPDGKLVVRMGIPKVTPVRWSLVDLMLV